MVSVRPFRGILYNQEKIRDLRAVTTPPYDVITEKAQDEYYRRHENNMVRLDLGKIHPGDTPADNRYTRAAADFSDWKAQGILAQDPRPAFYRYEAVYTPPHAASGETKVLKGFFAAVRLEPYQTGNVLPHEDTFPKVKEDRLSLLRACEANFSPIFCLYEDEEDAVQRLLEEGSAKQAPRIDFADDEGIGQRLWGLEDPGLLGKIEKLLASKRLLIADGHHRYETALAYREENPKADRMLMLLANLRDEGLSVLATHRVLKNLPAQQVDSLLKDLSRNFQVESGIQSLKTLLEKMEAAGKSQRALGLYTSQGDCRLLTAKPSALQQAMEKAGARDPSVYLDVSLFDQVVLEDLLGLKGGPADRGAHVSYIKDAAEGAEMVRRGEGQLAFFLNPVKIQVVRDLSQKGIKMPHKSTYFYPKPLSGLLIHAL